MPRAKILATALLAWVAMTAGASASAATEACHVHDHATLVECGSLDVPLDYDRPEGETLSVGFVRLASFNASTRKNPLFFLAGGPGQAATTLVDRVSDMFSEARAERDIVLIDQRGTGRSAELECETPELDLVSDYEYVDPTLLSQCVAELPAGIAHFTTANAIRDFEAVREHLGYPQVDLYGGSYGSRAAIAYLAIAGSSVGSVVLDGIAPPAMPIGLFGDSSAASFERALSRCTRVPECASAYPSLLSDFAAVDQQLRLAPYEGQIVHPLTGELTELRLWRSQFISLLRLTLYDPDSAAMMPVFIQEAARGNFAPLVAMAFSGGAAMGVNNLLYLTIVCNEDWPRFSETVTADDSDNSFGGATSLRQLDEACPLMPSFDAELDWMDAGAFPQPALLLSGAADPVTPPANGELAMPLFQNARHIVVEERAHIVAGSDCGGEMVAEFLNNPDPAALDASCVDNIPKQRFRLDTLGSLSTADNRESAE